ncbi:MAG: hypothetical protein ABII76_04425 [Pseudomonadota bacterium]
MTIYQERHASIPVNRVRLQELQMVGNGLMLKRIEKRVCFRILHKIKTQTLRSIWPHGVSARRWKLNASYDINEILFIALWSGLSPVIGRLRKDTRRAYPGGPFLR